MTANLIPLSERIPAATVPATASEAESITFDLKALRSLAFRARTSRHALRDESGALTGFADPRMPEDLTADDFASFLTYDDRASYLAWVAEWKATYAQLSEQIRTAETERREMQRAGDPKASAKQYECHTLSVSARMLLALRRVAKADSWARATAARTQASGSAN